jgi:hypothetical protein
VRCEHRGVTPAAVSDELLQSVDRPHCPRWMTLTCLWGAAARYWIHATLVQHCGLIAGYLRRDGAGGDQTRAGDHVILDKRAKTVQYLGATEDRFRGREGT